MKTDWKELTVSMTPAFIYEGDWLFKAQLRCLSEQTNKNFTVLVVDPHYSKRIAYMDEIATHYNLQIVHVPYYGNTHVGKFLDCAVFNAPYCYSESPRIVRYSCWRFVRPNFTDLCLKSETNVDFYFHSIEAPNFDALNEVTNHNSLIWDFGSDVVHWDKMPKAGEPGATWTHHSEVDAPATLFPKNAYGNYMVFREDWLKVNGCEEHFSSTHFEDMDFTIRARNAGITCERKALVMYRMHHFYGSYSGRSNTPVDHPHKSPCEQCIKASHVIEPKRFDLERRLSVGEIEYFDDKWVCKTCFLTGAIYHKDCGEYTDSLERSEKISSTINKKYLIGRNLNLLVADMNGRSLDEKIYTYAQSWFDEKYYDS